METKFNKYQFLQELEADIIKEIKSEQIDNIDSVYDFIYEYVDNACIYNSDCFAICLELGATDFTAYGIECNNIGQLAYACLSEYVDHNIDVDFVDDLINQPKN